MNGDKRERERTLSQVLEEALSIPIEVHHSPAPIDPPVDVKHTSREVVVFMDLPGVDEDEIHLAMEDGRLIVEGVREFDHDQEDSEEYLCLERPYGRFRKEVVVSLPVDFDGVTAKYKRGVLKVRLPIVPRVRPPHRFGGEM